ncbi:MAG: hypothetical protein AB8H12_23210 [Lewinella sp.]
MLKHFNCIVQIVNNTDQTLDLMDVQNKHGEYDPAPPNQIKPGEVIEFTLNHHELSPYGTAGSCLYRSKGGSADVAMSYRCPSFIGPNGADVLVQNSSVLHAHMIPNPLPESGHPMKVQFTISN